MIRIPLNWLEWAGRRRLFRRPDYLYIQVDEAPLAGEMESDLVYGEVRHGHPKWAHLRCPRCGEHVQLQIADATSKWSLRRDWLNRPSIEPSIWERAGCGAHFFVRRGTLIWCHD
jgi:Family of unknown function (DUF6527)